MSDVIQANGALLNFIERASRDENFDAQKFETLLRVRRDEQHDAARRLFNQAMAACQAEMQPVLRDANNPGVRSKYAKLETIDHQMRPIYTKHGFSVRFGSAPPTQPGWMRVTCTVAHEGGYYEENYLDSPVSLTGSQGGRIAMTPVQAVGSVVTYLRRYLLGMVFNIVQADIIGEDNDGATVMDRRAAQYMAGDPKPPSPDRTKEEWERWLQKLSEAVTGQSRAVVEEVGGRRTVRDAANFGPKWVQDEITRILGENYEPPADKPDDGIPFP